MHYVYVLESAREPKEKYVGCTRDLRVRLAEHNGGKSPHTAKHRPWNLVCYHAFADERRAIEFEQYLKTGSGRAFRPRLFPAKTTAVPAILPCPIGRKDALDIVGQIGRRNSGNAIA